jgi:hypothetical protein
MSRGSTVGIATAYGLYYRGVGIRVPAGSRIFTSAYLPDRLWGPIPYPMSTSGSSPGVKRQGREANHSLPTIAEIKETWIYTSTLPYAFMA